MDINVDLKKISLSIKEVSPIDPEIVDEPVEEVKVKSNYQRTPTKHSEVMSNTIGEILSDKLQEQEQKEEVPVKAEEAAEVAVEAVEAVEEAVDATVEAVEEAEKED